MSEDRTINKEELLAALSYFVSSITVAGETYNLSPAELYSGRTWGKKIIQLDQADRLSAAIEAYNTGDMQKLSLAIASELIMNDGSFFDFLVPKFSQIMWAVEAIEAEIITEAMITKWVYSEYDPSGMRSVDSMPTPPIFELDALNEDLTIKSNREAAIKALYKKLGPLEAFDAVKAAQKKWAEYNTDLKKYNNDKDADKQPREPVDLWKILHYCTQYLLYRGIALQLGDKWNVLNETGLHLLHRTSSTKESRQRKKDAYEEQHDAFKFLVEN